MKANLATNFAPISAQLRIDHNWQLALIKDVRL